MINFRLFIPLITRYQMWHYRWPVRFWCHCLQPLSQTTNHQKPLRKDVMCDLIKRCCVLLAAAICFLTETDSLYFSFMKTTSCDVIVCRLSTKSGSCDEEGSVESGAGGAAHEGAGLRDWSGFPVCASSCIMDVLLDICGRLRVRHLLLVYLCVPKAAGQ